jgi:adenylosuccinate synthase
VDQISICTAYEMDGRRLDHFPSDAFLLQRCQPVYETVPGWRTDISKVRGLTELPLAAQRYVDRLSQLLALPVTIISVGPDREQTIFCK